MIVHRAATDFQLFTEVYFPHYCTRPFNGFHKELFKTLKYGERNVRRARAASRGSAKSTFISFLRPLHDLCYGMEQFIIIISAVDPLAVKKLKNIRTEIQHNTALSRSFGVGFSNGKAGESEFLACSDNGETYFMAFGKRVAIRGVSHREKRPTKIICDDFEKSDEVENEDLRRKDEDRYFEDIGKAGDTGTNFEFVGTVLHKDSLLKKLLKNPRYDSEPPYNAILQWSTRKDLWDKWALIYMNLDDDDRAASALAYFEANKVEMLKETVVMWPEKETYYDHMVDLCEVGKRAFMKEKQNDPQGANDPTFERIHWYREVEKGLQIEDTGIIVPWDELDPMAVIDPATGQNKQKKGKLGDYACLLAGYKDMKGRVFAHYDWTFRKPPTKQIEAIFDVQEKFKIYKMGVETNLYRELLLPNIRDEKKRRESKGKSIEMKFYDIVQTDNKRERIFRIEPKVNHGHLLLNRALSQTFVQQVTDFPVADHDDCPDSLEMLWSLANNKYRAAATNLDPMGAR